MLKKKKLNMKHLFLTIMFLCAVNLNLSAQYDPCGELRVAMYNADRLVFEGKLDEALTKLNKFKNDPEMQNCPDMKDGVVDYKIRDIQEKLQAPIVLSENNTVKIDIERDAEASKKGNEFSITIGKTYVDKFVGPPDLLGVINSYYIRDSITYYNVMKLINDSQLRRDLTLKPRANKKGTTRLEVCDKQNYWLILEDSPEKLNVNEETFNKLIDQIVEMIGGEPEFGGPVTADPEDEDFIDILKIPGVDDDEIINFIE